MQRQISSRAHMSGLRMLPQARSVLSVNVSRKRFKHRLSAFNVEINHKGETHKLEVEDGTSVLEAAEEAGLFLPCDCRLGVCMTCPAKLVYGEVDQSASILSEDVSEKGYALLCISQPVTDCGFETIPEDELLDLQLKTSQM